MAMSVKNIKNIAENAICTACGACENICPVNAIQMKRNISGFLRSYIDEPLCIHCEKCTRVCPSVANNQVACELKDPLYGNAIKGYVGYAADEQIRKRGQSGGVITALLGYLLKEKRIQSALVNRYDESSNGPKPYIAKSKEDLLSATGSFYSQTAMLQKKYLRQQNYAAVLLGCQSEALELLCKEDVSFTRPSYVFGLVCAGQNSGKMIDDLCGGSVGVRNFKFRDKYFDGWPGNVSFEKDGQTIRVAKEQRFRSKQVFESYRCLLCFDQMNVFSDIVVGDPWGLADKCVPQGYSVFVTRNERGESLIQEAIQNGVIVAEEVPTESIFKGQKVKTMCLQKYSIGKKWCEEQQKLYPYANSLNIPPIEGITPKAEKDLRERLAFTEAFYHIQTEEALQLAIARRKKQALHQSNKGKHIRAVKNIIKKFVGRS